MKNQNKIIGRKRPRSYPLTENQYTFKQVLEECGIKKGITRQELVDAMINCVPKKWQEIKQRAETTTPE